MHYSADMTTLHHSTSWSHVICAAAPLGEGLFDMHYDESQVEASVFPILAALRTTFLNQFVCQTSHQA
jgi:hypothetical protein